MSACFKLVAILIVFLCLFCDGADAEKKDWIKGFGDRINDAKKMIGSTFNREMLDKFLNNGPSLWAKKAISKAQQIFYKKSMGTVLLKPEEIEKIRAQYPDDDSNSNVKNKAELVIPTSFDARKQWPNCPSIGEIPNQCGCGSCWAVSSAGVLSDRLCIASNGTRKARISALDLLSCCSRCTAGGSNPGDGCQGGQLMPAFEYFKQNGIVSGGLYGDKQSCKPYKWAPDTDSGFGAEIVAPKCEEKCENGLTYSKDKYYGMTAKLIQPQADRIQFEIMTRGSVVAGFAVPEDFMSYDGGVYYKHWSSGNIVGGHAVRIIGWGEEYGLPYWIIANSWGPTWGEKGTFRMVRGRNELGIESQVTTGDVDLYQSSLGKN